MKELPDLWELLEPAWKWLGLPGTAAIFSFIAVVVPILWKYLKQLWTLRKQREQLVDLHPFYTEQDKLDAVQYYIETKCQTEAPSKKDEPEIDPAPKEESLSFFINKVFKPANTESSRFHIILGGSGMGKTTFLINLYLRYIDQFVKPPYDIELFPLGYPNIDEKITAIEAKSNTILLLDAFDEDTQALPDHRSRLQTLVELTKEFRKVLITCRTQFFPSEEEEPHETGVLRYGPKGGQHVFRKLYLSPFDKEDIRAYLKQRFSWLQRTKRRRAQQIVLSCPSLMVRPMLLSHIDDLLNSKDTYTATYMVYAELIQRWIDRDAHKFFSERPQSYMDDLSQFSREIALYLYRRRTAQQGLWISGEEIQSFADRHGIKELSEVEMKSKSLLNRNALGQYKFSHKSILEYFLAKEAFSDNNFRKEFDFDGMSQAKAFFEEMVWEKLTVPFFSEANPECRYTMKNGNSRTLTRLPEKVLADITTLTLPRWEAEDDPVLVFSRLPSLQRLEVTDRHPAAILRAALRHQPLTVSEKRCRETFELDAERRPRAYVANQYEKRGAVVVDHATGLMWQPAGSENAMLFKDAQADIDRLNDQQFAGYTDWRLPTIPELTSLLESEKQSNELYIDPVFDTIQRRCWSADIYQIKGESSSESAWGVSFNLGDVYWDIFGVSYNYVRAVRS